MNSDNCMTMSLGMNMFLKDHYYNVVETPVHLIQTLADYYAKD